MRKSGQQSRRAETAGCKAGQSGHRIAVDLVGSRRRFPVLSLAGSQLLWSVFLASIAAGAETNSLSGSSRPVIHSPPPGPQQTAAAYERSGRKHEAAALYEAMASTNAATRKVLSHRLVAIYAEIGETNKALTWAREVMRDNPDPQAYLAAVHARLGQSQEARDILEREIARNTNATRAVTLRWQLAGVWEKAGDARKARKILTEAAAAAEGTAMESSARQRLNVSQGPGR